MEKINNVLFNWVLPALLGWVLLTTTIQAFKNDNLTNTQLFKRIPNSFILDFK